jgi:homoserine dehydrogenase
MKHLRVGIVGYGNLGQAAARLLREKRDTWKAEEELDLDLVCVLGRRGGLFDPNGLDTVLARHAEEGAILDHIPGFDPSLRFGRVVEERLIDLLLEFTPTDKDTGEPGTTHIREALKHGIHVATGNKGPILTAWEELSQSAREKGLLLGIGCATGGALPSIIAGREGMAGSKVSLIEGVLNGTTNFVLSRMESGLTYAEALKEAQTAGIAEANPAMDVEGWDTAVKLLILAKVVMKSERLTLKDVAVTGITNLTPEDARKERDAGRRFKLIGRAWREDGEVRALVAPESVGPEHPFYGVSAKDKCVRYVSDTLGDLFVAGGASGPIPAAAAVFRDVFLKKLVVRENSGGAD